jgi:proliferating cell nuclear antigen
MFDATLSNTVLFKNLVTTFKELVTDCQIECNAEGVSLQAMDSSHVALCAFELPASGFASYSCEHHVQLGLHLPSLERILKSTKPGDGLRLRADPDDTDNLELIFENVAANRYAEFELKLMDIDVDQLGVPDTEYPTVVTMPASDFQDVCKDLQIVGDTCTISVCPNEAVFAVAGDTGTAKIRIRDTVAAAADSDADANDEKGETTVEETVDDATADAQAAVSEVTQSLAKLKLPKSKGTKTKGTTTGKATAPTTVCTDVTHSLTVALRYLTAFAKAASLSDTVVLYMGKEMPLKLKYDMGDVGKVHFFLAPKLDDDFE